MSFNLTIPLSTGETLNHTIDLGGCLFILGANGVGKSSLMHHLYLPHWANARRILAHRQTWISPNATPISPQTRLTIESNIQQSDMSESSRWQDNISAQRLGIAIQDLVDAENRRARLITAAFDSRNIDLATTLSSESAPIKTINELLRLSNISIEISVSESGEVVASKCGSPPYSIAKLSDGERNALIISANVLTVKSGTLLLIDEPDRHLYPYIISPLLSLLFSKRSNDCAFIVSTHDVTLPSNHLSAYTLLIRNCTYFGYSISSWDADLVPPKTEIDDDLKKEILGARRKILFVEGTEQSLDKPLYSLVFPNVSIIPKSSWRDVKHAVSSIRESSHLHWVHAFGIVDKDGETESHISELKEKGIYALSVFSVESIYYHPELQSRVAKRHADITGDDASTCLKNAKLAAISEIKKSAKPLTQLIAEKAVREESSRHLPKKRQITSEALPINICIDISKIFTEKFQLLQDLLDDNNLTQIISQYPVHKTSALGEIAKALGFRDRNQYEGAVLKLLIDDNEALTFVKNLFGPLKFDIEAD